LTPPREDAEKYIHKIADVSRGAARIFLRGGLKLWKQKSLEKEKLLVVRIVKEIT